MIPRSPSDDIPWKTLGRYFAGELSEPEVEALRRWTETSPERAELVEELRRLWFDAPRSDSSWDVDAAIRRVMERPAAPARVIRLPVFYRERPRHAWARALRRVAGVAATVGLIGGGSWALWRSLSVRTPVVAAVELRTHRGERVAFRLPDGSEVMLGPASEIRYAIARDRGPRVVELKEGEGYFVVTHEASRPFTVRAAHAVATDLGTRFGVRAYASDSVVEIAVQEGRVALAPAPVAGTVPARAGRVELAARDLGAVTAGGRVYVERGADVADRLAWTEGRLVLDSVPLRDAVAQLSRWYDLDIRLGDSTSARRRLTATFRHESAADALRLIAATLGLRLETRDNVMVLWTQ